jgi:hypothetical protein
MRQEIYIRKYTSGNMRQEIYIRKYTSGNMYTVSMINISIILGIRRMYCRMSHLKRRSDENGEGGKGGKGVRELRGILSGCGYSGSADLSWSSTQDNLNDN